MTTSQQTPTSYHTPKRTAVTSIEMICPSAPRPQYNKSIGSSINKGPYFPRLVHSSDAPSTTTNDIAQRLNTSCNIHPKVLTACRLKPRPSKYTPPRRLPTTVMKKTNGMTRSSSYQYLHMMSRSQISKSLPRRPSFSAIAA